MNSMSEPAAEPTPDDAPEVAGDVQAVEPKDRAQADLLPAPAPTTIEEFPEPDSPLRRIQRTYPGAVWAPRDWEGGRTNFKAPEQPGIFWGVNNNPCVEAFREAQQKVEQAKQAIRRWHERLVQLQANLEDALTHQGRVEDAFAHFCETGEIDRDLLRPKREDWTKALLHNDQVTTYNKLHGCGRKLEDEIFAKSGWIIAKLNVDESYEYIKLKKSLDLPNITSTLIGNDWFVNDVDADRTFVYVTIRRLRAEPFTQEDADARVGEHYELFFKRWEQEPKSRDLAVAVARMNRAFHRSLSTAHSRSSGQRVEHGDRVDSEPRAPPN